MQTSQYWSGTDFIYMCLKDVDRTLAFQRAINEKVAPGQVVLDAGAGSGILSLFALDAGAGHVYAVEANPVAAFALRDTMRENGVAEHVTVLEGDVRDIDLPPVDVVIMELIETGLIEELQIPALNSLHKRAIIHKHTVTIPAGYKTFVQPVYVDESAYGHKLRLIRHEWPYYIHKSVGWLEVPITDVAPPVPIWDGLFGAGFIKEELAIGVSFVLPDTSVINGLRIAGQALMTESFQIGSSNAMNGDKIVPLPERTLSGTARMDIHYTMGRGFEGLTVEWKS
jgi:predicted RNA methylase